ncbi:S-layer homology domain-containing protein [Cellulomonas aerilata]|uniref:Fibronectin type-III domain-containing protein n=1 Tax=Cellulomonas aerilata TaxID=515326 RepID=A0A512D9Z6_9CELL|nr:S-layer homology domain-containing protein [Cellulomonas aerilata]GEO33314.1 hypothetical protein CAE01nite_10390 [Cellulomonas aerilata]
MLRLPGWTVSTQDIRGTRQVTVVPDGVDVVPPSAPVLTSPAGGWVGQGIDVRWQPSSDQVGVVSYAVLLDGREVAVVGRSVVGTSITATIGAHTVAVRALDAAGHTSTSPAAALLVGEAPTTPVMLPRPQPVDHGIRVFWEPVAVVPPVTGYSVVVRVSGSTWPPEEVARVTAPAGSTSVVVDGLTNGVEHEVTVEAVNDVGPSPSSSGHWDVTPGPVAITSPEPETDVTSPVELGWEVTGMDDVAYFLVSVAGRPVRFVPATARSVSLPILAGGYPVELGVQSVRADGTAEPASTVRVRPPTGAPTVLFPTVPWTHPFYDEIFWLAQAGITRGRADGTFGSSAPVSREAMAAFLFRYAGGDVGDYVPPATAEFPDVPVTHPFFREISWLAEAGITRGRADHTFGPGDAVSREAMAAFLHRFAEAAESGYVPDAESPFADVAPDHPFFTEISWLYESEISRGRPDGSFGPAEPVSREAMAAFLSRASTGAAGVVASPGALRAAEA